MNIFELKERFLKKENITQYIKKTTNKNNINSRDIEIIYDFQAGSYTENYLNTNIKNYYEKYSDEIVSYLVNFSIKPSSILEAGVGEATTLAHIIKRLNNNKLISFGMDISWSRLKYAESFLKLNTLNNYELSIGDLKNMPYTSNSIELVYTSHSIEPNGGNELSILKELYRVTKSYLVLLEPSYETSCDSIKKRMNEFGYCKNLQNYCNKLNFNIILHKKMVNVANVNNPTSITIIKKDQNYGDTFTNSYICPETKLTLKENKNFLYNDFYIYPKIMGIRCINNKNKILATKGIHFIEENYT